MMSGSPMEVFLTGDIEAAPALQPLRPESLFLPPGDRALLLRWVRAGVTSQRTALRSRIVLLLGEGLSAREVARRLGVSRHTVDLWRTRYTREGCGTLTRDRPGRGRKRGRQT